MVIAIVLAAGFGTRFAAALPKQFLKIHGKPIVNYCLQTFAENQNIDLVLPVVSKEYMDLFEKIAPTHSKILPPVCGGEERKYSVLSALNFIAKSLPNAKIVLIHDSARPFISHDIINNVISHVEQGVGCIPTLAVQDTIKDCENNSPYINKTITRDNKKLAQTPQGFNFNEIHQAYTKLIDHNFTDDAEFYFQNGHKVTTILGSIFNNKITSKDDFNMLEKLSSYTPEYRIGNGYDVHAFTHSKNSLIIFGVNIPYSKGFKAHSDGDVATHALIDALLGSVAQRDIGYHFPDNNPLYENMDSFIFLQKAIDILSEKNATIVNIDATIIAQEPKINPFIPQMIDKLSEFLSLDKTRINIKATTTEGLGFEGKKEGIACSCSVMIKL